MQFRIMFKDDIKDLRCFLASHIATINILLMTQAVSSISLAENDRHDLTSGLESKILAYRRHLEGIRNNLDLNLEQQRRIRDCLHQQHSGLEELRRKNDETNYQLRDQAAVIQAVHTSTKHTGSQTTSILEITTQVLASITSGLVQIKQISQQLTQVLQICANFTTEMRGAMSKVIELFNCIHTTLQRIDHSLPARPHLPTVQFTTALGETMALPFQLCQQWETLIELMGVITSSELGRGNLLKGDWIIISVRRKIAVKDKTWVNSVSTHDHLSMMVVTECCDTSAKFICPLTENQVCKCGLRYAFPEMSSVGRDFVRDVVIPTYGHMGSWKPHTGTEASLWIPCLLQQNSDEVFGTSNIRSFFNS
ncbi:hypothetical protein IQ06DRAFT_117281 [Phaeosphaeriaceae sp. SRC1lsM3a]|nr:hypothetical protein IQ06DRAFT_117281 [Stagonospora sp. SRC1lsM3a]